MANGGGPARSQEGRMDSRGLEVGVPAVIEALRAATRSRHEQLGNSTAMLRLFDAAYTISEYRSHLGRLLGLFEPLERAAARAAHPSAPVYSFQRSSALRQDLRIMGATAEDIDALELSLIH